MTSREKVAALRRLMKKEGMHAYLVPSNDPHLSEYVPECWKRRQWVSGFTGSAGDVVVFLNEAGLWTDSRYFLQAERQLDGETIKLFKQGLPDTPSIDDYLIKRLKRGQAVGIDPQVISEERAAALTKTLDERGIRLRFTPNLVDPLWDDRPPMPRGAIDRHADRFAGETAEAKLARVREELIKADADAHIVTALDAIAWLFNIRGTDVEFNPVVIAYAIVGRRSAELFLDRAKVGAKMQAWLNGFVKVRSYEEAGDAFRALGKRKARVMIDAGATNRWVVERLKGATIRRAPSPIQKMKAVKNETQIRGLRNAHRRDGVAMVRFLHWLENRLKERTLRELDVAEKCDAFRAEEAMHRGPSFDTIVGFGANGAVVHYSPVTGENAKVGKRGILLIDSGGQYLDGTTDITRTITIGEPSAREKELFTRVLKGHINLARTPFPRNMTGIRLEILARQALWEGGVEYGHGTGHGVGQYLSVHEGPVGFSPRALAPLEPGNFISLEPGCYSTGKYGFRTENLVIVVKDKKRSTKEQEWCALEALTLCPIDRKLIEPALLSKEERDWLNEYHARVMKELSPRLAPEVSAWLAEQTAPL
ncbi:MAG: aminopeptidase P family protein [Candidatus Eisenbacteria bacterium]|nr:aminopeptidase P family protein [Candidatus Eisenbacteria bacterium]